MQDNQKPEEQLNNNIEPEPIPQPVESKAGSLIEEMRKESTISRLTKAGISFISFGILVSAGFAFIYPASTNEADPFVPIELPQTGSESSTVELQEYNLDVTYPNEEWILAGQENNYLKFAYIPNINSDFGTIPFIEVSGVTYDKSGIDAENAVNILQEERLRILLQSNTFEGKFEAGEMPTNASIDFEVIRYTDTNNTYTLFSGYTEVPGVIIDLLVTQPEGNLDYQKAIDRFVSEFEVEEQFLLPETGEDSDQLPQVPEDRNKNVLLAVILINLSIGVIMLSISFIVSFYNNHKRKELASLIPRE